MDLYGKVSSYKCKNEYGTWVRYFTLITNMGSVIQCKTEIYLPLIETDVVLLSDDEECIDGVYVVKKHPYVLMDPGEDLVKYYFDKALVKPGLKKELLDFYEYIVSNYRSSNPNDIVNRIEDMVMMYDRGEEMKLDFSRPFLDAIYSWFRKNVCIRRFTLLNLTKDEVKSLFNCYDIPTYELYSKILQNPYMLFPVGQQGCDKAFKVLRFNPTPIEREYGNAMILLYNYVSVKGWTCIPDASIPELIMKNKDYFTKQYDLVWFHNYVYFPITHKVEMRIMDWFKEKLSEDYVEFDNDVDRILSNNISIVVGEAGTGKTTLISKVIQNIISNSDKFHVCSFTGKAVQRAMQVLENSGELSECFSTIHRLILEPRDIDYLIIDESSMVSMPLFYSLLNVIPKHTKVLFVGDPNQLEPIEWGHLLECLIHCKSLQKHIIRLTTVYRQKEGTGLMNNIRSVVNNKTLQNGENFQLCSCLNKQIDEMITGIMSFEYENNRDQSLMVLSPYVFKLKYINDIARNIMLGPTTLITDKWGNTFTKGDKVMLTSNDMNEGGKGALFNGDEGEIVAITDKLMVKWTRTGDIIGYDPTNDYDEQEISISIFGTGRSKKTNSTKLIQVCYGITCHKSQGSEWDTIIFVNPWKDDSKDFVNRRLIYTSLSRARNKCYIVGDVKSINMAIRRPDSYSVTLLPYHIDNK